MIKLGKKNEMPYVFLIFTMGAFLLAEIFPWAGSQEGSQVPYFTGKYLAVALIFLLCGLYMKPKTLRTAGRQWKIAVFIQSFNFVLIPITIRLIVALCGLIGTIDPWIVNGFITLSCMPPPLSSAVILTKVAGGNEATAIVNSALGSLIGILLTPALLLLHSGMSSTIPMQNTLVWLLVAGLVPVLLGFGMRHCPMPAFPERTANLIWNFALLLAIFTSFCDVFQQRDFAVSAAEFLVIVLIVIVSQILLGFLSVKIVTQLHVIDEKNVVAVLFCSTHKSLTLGLPIVKTLYGGYAHLSHVSLPLLVYHPVQLILGSLIAPKAVQMCSRYTDSRHYLPS